ICHAMTTLATGGYSTHDASIGYFHSAAIEWVSIVFMTLGAMPFGLYIIAVYGQPERLFRDDQVRLFLGIIATATLLLLLWLMIKSGHGFWLALREAAFATVSTMTTTGF